MTDHPDQATALRAIATEAREDIRARTDMSTRVSWVTERALAVWLNRQDRRTAQLAEHLADQLDPRPDQGTVEP